MLFFQWKLPPVQFFSKKKSLQCLAVATYCVDDIYVILKKLVYNDHDEKNKCRKLDEKRKKKDLFSVSLREVINKTSQVRQAHERACASMP